MPSIKKKTPAKTPATTPTSTPTGPWDGPYQLGLCYLFRTVTNYRVGRLVAIHQAELVLEDSSWVCDTGRYHDCLKNGTFSEVEPSLNPVILNRSSVVDVDFWPHALPRTQK